MPLPVRQAAAIPIREGLVCMVTSRSGQRWVVPKGRIEVKQTPGDAALAEAWEEAGLLGILTPNSVGSYHYEKDRRDHHVTVFVLHVTEERSEWPEQRSRQREWITFAEAMRRIVEPGLQAIFQNLLTSFNKLDSRS